MPPRSIRYGAIFSSSSTTFAPPFPFRADFRRIAYHREIQSPQGRAGAKVAHRSAGQMTLKPIAAESSFARKRDTRVVPVDSRLSSKNI